jgi:outer membrane protein
MKKSLIAILVAGLMAPALSFAEQGDFVVRLRATHIAPDDSSKLYSQTLATTGGLVDLGSGAHLSVDSNTIPEMDFSYYITKNIAAELILATGTRHDVSIKGSAAADQNLGKVNLLPPTLTAQWHFNPDQTFDPYAGAGLSYVRAMDNGLFGTGLGSIHIDKNMWGPALQAGFDVNLQDKWLVNFDVKKIWFNTDVKLEGVGKIDNLDIDPWVVSFGVGKKF